MTRFVGWFYVQQGCTPVSRYQAVDFEDSRVRVRANVFRTLVAVALLSFAGLGALVQVRFELGLT